jgi:hypothetical protein
MQRIRKQFGKAFADAIALCPTLQADLQQIRANGVKIRKVGGHCQAYSMTLKKTIYIGSKCSLSYQLISLAHEKVHVLVSPTPNPVPGRTSRKAFIDMCLEAETDCIEHEVIVVGELLAAGIKVDAHSMKWYRLHQQGGRAAIRAAIEKAVTSNTGEAYPEYYGGWYDEAVKPKDRLALHASQRRSRKGPPGLDIPVIRVNQQSAPPAERNCCARFLPNICETPVHVDLSTNTGKNSRPL